MTVQVWVAIWKETRLPMAGLVSLKLGRSWSRLKLRQRNWLRKFSAGQS